MPARSPSEPSGARPDDHDRYRRVQHQLMAHTSQEQFAETAQAAASGHDQVGMHLVGDRDQRRRWPPRTSLEHGPISDTSLREILGHGGVHWLTVEGVAARSGVAKTTIYRRWRSKEDLALAALLEVIQQEAQPVRQLGRTQT